ncbi:hypothetical protein IWQ61_005947 [Dispira simplex]|nr:hypothetical protein IWQ61_005947 [Dispira simplex]
MAPTVFLSRTATFSAAHRLHSTQLDSIENARIFGKCNWANGHGHNYRVEITVKGRVDPVTGMVMNITDLKEAIQKAIMDPLDHRNLDVDVKFFRDRPSTTENLAIFIWTNIQTYLPPNLLHRVRIDETDQNCVEYYGPEITG